MRASEVETGNTTNKTPEIAKNKVDDGIVITFRRLERNHKYIRQKPNHCQNRNKLGRRVFSKSLSCVLPIFRFKPEPLDIRSELFYL